MNTENGPELASNRVGVTRCLGRAHSGSDGKMPGLENFKRKDYRYSDMIIYIMILILLMEEILHHLRLVVYPGTYKV